MSDDLLTVDRLRLESNLGAEAPDDRRRDHDLNIAAGESVGIVGESGCGKSLTARALLGLLPPGVTASGSVRFEGSRSCLAAASASCGRFRGRHISLLLQDPYTLLNPLMRVGRQITQTLKRASG